ncbi:MAG: hypothetical protein JWN67_5017 [Actinomycetia bacterium]|nr:hypothetical protein [Actinomycetes bacterium]
MTERLPGMENLVTPGRFATISPCGRYRYDLGRHWGPGPSRALWCMLNPSTADDTLDDQTVGRVTSYTKREGLDGFVIVNLFAWRSPNPHELAAVDDPVGPDNPATIQQWLASATVDLVIVAWGAGVHHARQARLPVLLWAAAAGHQVHCLGRTAAGEPRHPSRLSEKTPLEVYP